MSYRLLALNHFANPLNAPGGTRMVELSERLEGWDTVILAADRNLFTRKREVCVNPGYRTLRTLPYGSSDASRIANWASFAAGAVLRGLGGRRPDVVYASSPHLLTGLAGWFVSRVRGARFVLEIRDIWPKILADTGRLDPVAPTYRALRRLEHFLYSRADRIVALSEGVAAAIADEGVPAERIVVIPNGAEPDDFLVHASRHELRRRHGFDGLVVLYAGAHGVVNALDLVLDAAAELRDELPDVRFVLVGDGIAKPALVRRAKREGLSNVRFLGPVAKYRIPPLLASSDVGLHVLADLPLFTYGISPNKLFDYMAAGLPVLTNTAGEIGDLIKSEEAGVVVSATGLASGVRQLHAAGEEQRAVWGDNGRQFIQTQQSRTKMAHRLQALLDSLMPHG